MCDKLDAAAKPYTYANADPDSNSDLNAIDNADSNSDSHSYSNGSRAES